MPINFGLTDETGASSVLAADSSHQLDIGGAAPTGPLSMDGVVMRNSAAQLGDALAPPASAIRTSGSVSVAGAGGTATVSISLSRNPLVQIGQLAVNNGAFISSSSSTQFVITNLGSTQTITYTYI